jgi:hypothetical protein
LNGLDEEIILLARNVVRTLDADLKTRSDSSGEDTTEGIETTLIRGRYHLGDVQHKRSLRVTLSDANAALIIRRTLVEGISTVLLGGDRGRQVQDHHLHKSIGGRKESSHDNLEQLLALLLPVFWGKLDAELFKKDWDFVLLEVHNGSEDSENGVQDKLVESTF